MGAYDGARQFVRQHDANGDGYVSQHEIPDRMSDEFDDVDRDSDGYTNLEEYINEVGAWPAPRPITWTGGTGRYALNQNWDTWQPTHFDEVRINSGTATIDAYCSSYSGMARWLLVVTSKCAPPSVLT